MGGGWSGGGRWSSRGQGGRGGALRSRSRAVQAARGAPSQPVLPRLPPRLWARPQDYVQALTGFCYDGVEGLIYLALFSFATALMFSSIVCSVPHTWQQKR